MAYKGFDLTGKSIIITGAGTGIGKAISIGMAQSGANVVLIGRRIEPLQETEQEIAKEGVKALILQGDVADLAFHEKVVVDTVSEFGKIDALVNNAAILFNSKIEDTTEEIWDKTMSVNLKGAFFLAVQVGRQMIHQKSGKIINVLSDCAYVAEKGMGVYCSTKGGLLMATRCMATEWGHHGVLVNAIGPANVDTPINDPFKTGPNFGEWSNARIPLHRMAEAEEMVGAALFLASDSASFVNGAVIMLDGGYTVC